MSYKPFLIAGAILITIYISWRIFKIVTLENGLKEKIRNGAVILDVRTPHEFESGHIPGAVNLQLSKLHHGPLPLDTSVTYITVCSHGLRSVKAVSLLHEQGFKKAYNGGAWTDLQRSLEQ